MTTKQIGSSVSGFCYAEAIKDLDQEQEKENLEIFLELGSIGAGHAATALSAVLQQPVNIEVPKILTVPSHLLPKYYKRHDTPTEAVYLQLLESYGCDILLMIELSEAKKIASMMTMVASIDEVDPEMEASAIRELANILIGSFLTAISDFSGVKLMPTTPQSIVDSFDAIMDNFIVKQSLNPGNAMIFETRFMRDGEDAKSILMIFPSQELKDMLINHSKKLIEV